MRILCLHLLLALLAAPGVSSMKLQQSPVTQVVSLLGELKTKIEADGSEEQASYDKFACWCEDTLARKANDITSGKERITELEGLVVKLGGEISSLGADLKQLEKDIAANIESTKEATGVRNKEFEAYQNEKTESEQCIGALEAAIKVLTGAGSGAKTGFLGTLQETQVLSVVAGIRGTLRQPLVTRTVSNKELDVVRSFIDHPENFLGNKMEGGLSAVQIAQNPFGDYAPASGQVQGILKGMYDAFTSDLEKANVDEAGQEKVFRALMATKQRELATLQATLETQTADKAAKTMLHADSKTELDDARVQLKADQEFFAETKKSCKTKATEWSNRTRLRTEELHGIAQAMNILSSGAATFERSATTLLQVSAVKLSASRAGLSKPRKQLLDRLSKMAAAYQSTGLAQIAVELKTGGHFDKVIAMIQNMIELLKREEADDIAHKDRCEAKIIKNENEMEDLSHSIQKAESTLTRMNNTETELKEKVEALEQEISATNQSIYELKEMRATEDEQHKTALRDDYEAIDLIDQAIVALTRFYKDNKIELELAQKKKEDPEVTVDPDKAPETNWQGGDYRGRQGEHEGVIAILEMIKEDIQNEIKMAGGEDSEAQAQYISQLKTLQETMVAQKESKVATERQLVDLQKKMIEENFFKNQKDSDLSAQQDLQSSLAADCDWVNTHFESRKEKRKAEMDGLVEAMNYLAGVEADDDEE